MFCYFCSLSLTGNCMSEFMGLIYGKYEAKVGKRFSILNMFLCTGNSKDVAANAVIKFFQIAASGHFAAVIGDLICPPHAAKKK